MDHQSPVTARRRSAVVAAACVAALLAGTVGWRRLLDGSTAGAGVRSDARRGAERGWLLAEERPWFHAGSLPMYYINLDRSADRRVHMQMHFGGAGSLTRVAGVDGRVPGVLESYLTPPEEFLNGTRSMAEPPRSRGGWLTALAKGWKAKFGELSLTIGHWHALKEAYASGAEVALVLEDDASPMLAPFWTTTLADVAELATKQYPNWKIIRLQWHNYIPHTLWHNMRLWRKTPGLVLMMDEPDKARYYGSVAYLVRREGMRRFIETLTADDGVGFNCSSIAVRCVSDWALPAAMMDNSTAVLNGGTGEVLMTVPPMFGVGLYEMETGTRGAHRKGADPVGYHEYSVVRSLRLVMENFQFWSLLNELKADPAAAPDDWLESSQFRQLEEEVSPSGLEMLAARPLTSWGMVVRGSDCDTK